MGGARAREVPGQRIAKRHKQTGQPPGDAAAAYTEAAAQSFRALLQRIETVTRRLAGRDPGPYAEIVNLVVAMLADPWVHAPVGWTTRAVNWPAAGYFVKPILL